MTSTVLILLLVNSSTLIGQFKRLTKVRYQARDKVPGASEADAYDRGGSDGVVSGGWHGPGDG